MLAVGHLRDDIIIIRFINPDKNQRILEKDVSNIGPKDKYCSQFLNWPRIQGLKQGGKKVTLTITHYHGKENSDTSQEELAFPLHLPSPFLKHGVYPISVASIVKYWYIQQ